MHVQVHPRFLSGLRLTVYLAAAVTALALWTADLGWAIFPSDALNLLLTIVWVVGLVNAFNLMDNLDGALGTVGLVCAAGGSTAPACGTSTTRRPCRRGSEPPPARAVRVPRRSFGRRRRR